MKKNNKTTRRFYNERVERLVKEDVRDVERVRDLSAFQVLLESGVDFERDGVRCISADKFLTALV